jgi:hypothetical protein
VTVGNFVQQWSTGSIPPDQRLGLFVVSVAVPALTFGAWRVIDRIADRRGAGDTQIYQLVPQTRIIGAAVSLVVMIPDAVAMIAQNGFRAALPSFGRQLGFSAPATIGILGNISALRGVGNLTAGVLAIVAGIWLARRGRRGVAELATVIGVLSIERGVRVVGWLPIGFSTFYLSSLAALVTLTLAAVWLIRRRLTHRRIAAVMAALLLSLALVHREVLSDPLAVVLGTGGSLLAFGLIWSLLTGAEDANGDSVRFPRSARAILVTANLALVMIALAADRLARTSIVGLDAIVEEGAAALGDPLLITGIWAVLAAAWRDEEVREAAPESVAVEVR